MSAINVSNFRTHQRSVKDVLTVVDLGLQVRLLVIFQCTHPFVKFSIVSSLVSAMVAAVQLRWQCLSVSNKQGLLIANVTLKAQ